MANIDIFSVNYVKEKGNRYVFNKKLDMPQKVCNLLNDLMSTEELAEEYVYLVCINSKGGVTAISEVSHGSLNMSIVSPREIFKRALVSNACAIILAHNHPSGDVSPSPEDIKVTKRIQECGKLMEIPLYDHLIVCGEKYYSFKEKDLM